jgi:hypothetical protein
MGTFAVTAIVDYYLPLADQGKLLGFSFPFAANERKFAVSVLNL